VMGKMLNFKKVGAMLCNDLPPELKNSDISRQNFKSCLKSWLF